mgnify:CR=1 FL=1
MARLTVTCVSKFFKFFEVANEEEGQIFFEGIVRELREAGKWKATSSVWSSDQDTRGIDIQSCDANGFRQESVKIEVAEEAFC